MNTQELRQSVKAKWLEYYRENRHWLVRLAVWVNDKGQRRPSSSFILATLSVLEPQLPFLFPVIVELSNDPDRIVTALGLNFNPDKELEALEVKEKAALNAGSAMLLPPNTSPLMSPERRTIAQRDADCRGNRSE
uniref:DUF5331 domain-containing protein n=1 Tax=Cyanothece sp. (strain PCC 7425 / ATCC 29141) TaxID=395961 RepID=B8HUQ4_CYAP4